ncbi:hypothetical protein R3P38DRAFT_2555038 [Favolaschia claudopus]|uniref:Uncharacterized protein n=1 Tax=Favolaschia claudopus TaxID=2862362 RepID=A0AAW0ADR0_9AGAR
MRLPNGQIVRSVWKDDRTQDCSEYQSKIYFALHHDDIQLLTCLQYIAEDESTLYGEVQFFFQASVNGDEKTLALISVYSPPNAALLEKSFQTVAECNYFGDDNLQVISILQIEAGVGMIPVDDTGKYFVAEKLGLELESMAGALEDDMNTE